jgi:RNA recognition motif-containing protein
MGLYVGNLPPRLCFPELEDWFIPFGQFGSAELMTDPATGWSRGFAFVEMANNEEGQTAMTALNGREVEGKTLVVNEASLMRGAGPRERGPRPGGDSDRPSSGPVRSRGTRLFVGNLPYTATAADIETLFKESGTVSSVSLVSDRGTGQSKGFAFVEMGSKEEAEAAIKRYDGQTELGRILKVNEARPAERRSGPGRPFGGGGGGGRRY